MLGKKKKGKEEEEEEEEEASHQRFMVDQCEECPFALLISIHHLKQKSISQNIIARVIRS